MRLFIDCTNGVSSDMILKALLELTEEKSFVKNTMENIPVRDIEYAGHRSYKEIKQIISDIKIKQSIKTMALNIYQVIATAEAEVHGETLDTVHFHEVGREEAIKNIVGICAAIETLRVDEIFCSKICDGSGTIECSHGTIPVPVPAVEVMKKQCDFEFIQEDVNMEMVTPSGLGVLIGIGAVKAGTRTIGKIIKTGVGHGSRDTGRDGLRISIIEMEENMKKKLYRSKDDKMIAGVCGGIAEYFSLDPSLVRVGFVVGTLLGLSGIIAYIIMALIVPEGENS